MTLIDKSTTQKVAFLARLSDNDLTEEEKERFSNQLEAILEYVQQLNEVDVSGLAPTDGWRTNHIEDLRADEPDESEDYQRIRKNILRNFPKCEGDLLVIPGIFENN